MKEKNEPLFRKMRDNRIRREPRGGGETVIRYGVLFIEETIRFKGNDARRKLGIPLQSKRHTLLSDKMGFHFFELKKLPKDIAEDNALLLWLSLFNANTEEDLEKIKAMEVPEMNQAINAYYSITASSEFREVERLREKARHDEAQALYHAKQEGISERNIEIAKNLLKMGMPLDQIAQATGLPSKDVEVLQSKA